MLIISREALIKIGRHAWNVCPLEAFGYLLGKETGEVYAALPFSKTQVWYHYEDRWLGMDDTIDTARVLGQMFDLTVVGVYASTTDDYNGNHYPIPAVIKKTRMELFLLYQVMCCTSCSGRIIKLKNDWLQEGKDWVIPRGIRSSNAINQKRILKEWHKVYGEVDYSNNYLQNEN